MAALAFVEEIGRHGNVVQRHVLHRLPARIGRGYDADVVIDDPHIAAAHLEIRQARDGQLEAVDCGSINGTLLRGHAAKISTLRIHGDDVLHIGQTQLRIRLPSQAVAAELPLVRRYWSRHPVTFFVAAGVLAALATWHGYVNTFNTDAANIFSAPIIAVLVVLTWATVWSMVCRSWQGNANFWAHAVTAFLGGVALQFVDTATEYFYFAFDLDGFDPGWKLSLAATFAVVLYRHLRLTIRWPARNLGLLTLLLVALLVASFHGYQTIRDANQPGLQSFNKIIKPNTFSLIPGMPPAQFVGSGEKLKARGDSDAEAMTQ